MNSSALAPLAHSLRPDNERRVAVRHSSAFEAISRPLDTHDTLSWGAQVHDVSAHGIGLIVCYPFKPGTYLAIDIDGYPAATRRTLLARVVHAQDQADGSWKVGCEFVKQLTQSEVELLV